MIYRRRALLQLDAPEELDQAIRLASVPGWLVTAVMVVVVGGAFAWGAVADVPRTVNARGVITHSAGVTTLQATTSGLLTQVWAPTGGHVAKGDRLYTVTGSDGAPHTVTSPWDADIAGWQVHAGQVLAPGMDVAGLVRLDTPGDRLQARVFLPSAYAAAVRVGMETDLAVDAAPSSVFGTVHGRVAAVGTQPETADSVRAFLGDSADAARLLGEGDRVAVTVTLDAQPGSAAGLRWSKNQPPFALSADAVGTARFTVATEHPLDWLVDR